MIATSQNLDDISWETVDSLEKIGIEAMQQKAKGIAENTLDAIFDIGNKAIENKLWSTAYQSKSALERLAKKANKQEYHDIENLAMEKVKNVKIE